MSRRVLIGAVLVLGAAVLVVEGYFVLRFYEDPPGGGDVPYRSSVPPDGATEEETQGTTAQEQAPTPEGSAIASAFVHTATVENSRENYTYLDDPSSNGDPDAVLIVTPLLGADGGAEVLNDKNVGVWYEPERRLWAIFNQDRTAIPGGAAFNVIALPPSEEFVHGATPANTAANSTFVDHPLANENPAAVLSVTPNWSPPGDEDGGVYNDHPVGVRYDSDRQRWAVFNRDLAPIPDGTAFNVAISEVR